MTRPVIITCAVTGGGDTVGKHPAIPVTPEQIASAAIEAGRAGAAIAHIHVRDPATGRPSMDPALFREVADRIGKSGSDIIVNLTTGEGGILTADGAAYGVDGLGTAIKPPAQRVAHVEAIRPEMCTLDMGSLNFSDRLMRNTPGDIEAMAGRLRAAGALPELEVFDTGHIAFTNHLLRTGVLEVPALFQLCLGIFWGAPATTATMLAMRDMLPAGSLWAAFGIGPHQFPMVAQAVLLGGHVRVGLEDNLYLERGVLAPSNAALVEKAAMLVEALGHRVASPAEARDILGSRNPGRKGALP